MIETLISSKTRIKLLLKFFLNSNTVAYLRSLENEFGESSNAIRIELNRLEEAGMLSSFSEGNKKMFRANTLHPLFKEVHNIMLKTLGLDQIIETVIERLGQVEKVYLVGDFARGLDSPIIDLLFLGDPDKNFLLKLAGKAEELIKRKIRYLIYQKEEFDQLQIGGFYNEALLLWSNDQI
jgi:predicted nucleotidyltransferase